MSKTKHTNKRAQKNRRWSWKRSIAVHKYKWCKKELGYIRPTSGAQRPAEIARKEG